MIINVLELLEQSAKRYPDKCAVYDGEQSLTYAQLLEKSKAVGSALADIVKIGKPVGVYMEKSVDTLVAFYGIVYAGGCYCLLSPELPDNRLGQVQSVVVSEIIITSSDLGNKARSLFRDETVLLIEDLERQPCHDDMLRNIREGWTDVNPLYINFTSGSTGVPKGIVVSHRSVIDFISCFTEIFNINETDVIANQAPFDFDVSVKDIYSALSTGAQLVIIPRRLFSAPKELVEYICENKATTLIWAVSALCLISTFHCLEYRVPETVTKVLFSGETMPFKQLVNWQQHLPRAQFVNLYGPTEITCNCTYHILEGGRDYSSGIPIGKPFPNEDIFLVDEQMQLITEANKTGEIIVRGTALALGYYRQPEQTQKSFIDNPINGLYPETVYRTGDLAFFNERKELIFCGRRDNQIKYMGHRIEIDEIEKYASEMNGVERFVCVFDSKKSRLKGYYTGSIGKEELYKKMKVALPSFMVPDIIRKVEQLPLSKNGKTDRKKLSEL